MKMWNRIKIRFSALMICTRAWLRMFSKIAILDKERLDGNGSRVDRLLPPLEKGYRREVAGKGKMTRTDIARYEFLSAMACADEKEFTEAIEDTLQTLLLWTSDLRTRKSKEE